MITSNVYLRLIAAEYNMSLNPNLYANAIHDSVWATGIALNVSWQTIKNGTAEKIRNQNNTVLETANNELSNVSFTGAYGNVHLTTMENLRFAGPQLGHILSFSLSCKYLVVVVMAHFHIMMWFKLAAHQTLSQQSYQNVKLHFLISLQQSLLF